MNYDKLTEDDFTRILTEIISEESSYHLIMIPGVYDVLAEYYNNAVLERWEEEQE